MINQDRRTVDAPFQLQLQDADENSLDQFFASADMQQRVNEPRHVQKESRKKRGFFSMLLQIIGELLLTAGIFLGLFVLWTAWWTNVTSGQVLDKEAVQIQKDFGEKPPEKPAPAQEGEPPKVEPVGKGEAFAIMRIPAFGLDNQTAIKEGTDKSILDQGVFSHYKDTAMPGDIGNFATAAHRDIYGARLRDVDKLKEGMPVVVETKDAFLVYKIIGSEIVDPTDIYTIEPDPFVAKDFWLRDRTLPAAEPTRRLLTLTTCDPIMVASHRYIVYAEFEYWTKRGDGLPKELLPDAKTDTSAMNGKTVNETTRSSSTSIPYGTVGTAHNSASALSAATELQTLAFGPINSELRESFSIAEMAAVKED